MDVSDPTAATWRNIAAGTGQPGQVVHASLGAVNAAGDALVLGTNMRVYLADGGLQNITTEGTTCWFHGLTGAPDDFYYVTNVLDDATANVHHLAKDPDGTFVDADLG